MKKQMEVMFHFFTVCKQHMACKTDILPLEIIHQNTWHDYPWTRASLTWLYYNLQLDYVRGADFENSLYIFGQPEKR